jgi:hypothetical protein
MLEKDGEDSWIGRVKNEMLRSCQVGQEHPRVSMGLLRLLNNCLLS